MIFAGSIRLVATIVIILSISVRSGILHKVIVAREAYGNEDSYVYEDSEGSSSDDQEGSSYIDESDLSTVEETIEESVVVIVADPDDVDDDIESLIEESDLVIDEYEEDEAYRRKR